MLWPETNRKVAAAFENGELPTMVYINKQSYERQPVRRPLHRHESICELLLIYSGKGTYTLEGTTYEISEGSVICYNQGDLHEMSSGVDQDLESYCIGIANLKKKGFPQNHLLQKGEPCVRSAGAQFPALKTLCEQMYELEGSGAGENLAAQLLCAAMILMVGQLGEEGAVCEEEKDEIIVRRIRDYLNEHFTEELRLATVAQAIGCSETYVSHLFKRVTGKTPMQYVIRRRIGLAQTLLISTELSATEIATRVGYDNTNYFITLFAKVVGMTPIRYRKHYKSEMKGMHSQL